MDYHRKFANMLVSTVYPDFKFIFVSFLFKEDGGGGSLGSLDWTQMREPMIISLDTTTHGKGLTCLNYTKNEVNYVYIEHGS